MRRKLDRSGITLALVATGTVAVVAGALLLVIVVEPMLTQPGTHAAEDATFGLVVFAPLWIAGTWGAVLAVGLWRGRAGRLAGLAWAIWAGIAGMLVAAVTGLGNIIGLAVTQGSAGVAGYNLARPELYIAVALWVAAVVMVVALARPSRPTSYLR